MTCSRWSPPQVRDGRDLLRACPEVPQGPYPHLERADLLVIARSTKTLARLAHGLAGTTSSRGRARPRRTGARRAGDEDTSACGASRDPGQRRAPARARGRGPRARSEGELAEGEAAQGAWSSPRDRGANLRAARRRDADGHVRRPQRAHLRRGTREPLDQSAYVGNRSSGDWASRSPRRRSSAWRACDSSRVEPRGSAPAGVTVVETPTAADSSARRWARGTRTSSSWRRRSGTMLPPLAPRASAEGQET